MYLNATIFAQSLPQYPDEKTPEADLTYLVGCNGRRYPAARSNGPFRIVGATECTAIKCTRTRYTLALSSLRYENMPTECSVGTPTMPASSNASRAAAAFVDSPVSRCPFGMPQRPLLLPEISSTSYPSAPRALR